MASSMVEKPGFLREAAKKSFFSGPTTKLGVGEVKDLTTKEKELYIS